MSDIERQMEFCVRLQLGEILNIHKFFRRLAKPLAWIMYYSALHLGIMTLLTIAEYVAFDNANLNLAAVKFIIIAVIKWTDEQLKIIF